MNKDKYIEKSKELIKMYNLFRKWITKYDKDIAGSQRGFDYLLDINQLESELQALESEPENESIQSIMDKIARFSDEKFGIERPYTAPLYHLKKEIEEAIGSGEIEEFADMQLLLMDSYRKRFPDMSAQILLNCCNEKINTLHKRVWGKPDENGVVEHIESEEPAKQLYLKVYIRDVKDLPVDGTYIAHYRSYDINSPAGTTISNYDHLNSRKRLNWIERIDWYLKPLK